MAFKNLVRRKANFVLLSQEKKLWNLQNSSRAVANEIEKASEKERAAAGG